VRITGPPDTRLLAVQRFLIDGSRVEQHGYDDTAGTARTTTVVGMGDPR